MAAWLDEMTRTAAWAHSGRSDLPRSTLTEPEARDYLLRLLMSVSGVRGIRVVPQEKRVENRAQHETVLWYELVGYPGDYAAHTEVACVMRALQDWTRD